jgi:hypothetical protein
MCTNGLFIFAEVESIYGDRKCFRIYEMIGTYSSFERYRLDSLINYLFVLDLLQDSLIKISQEIENVA